MDWGAPNALVFYSAYCPDDHSPAVSLCLGALETKELVMPAAETKPLLELDRCTIRFGGLTAVSDLTMCVSEQQLFGLIGPNGAGKTTVFNLITGVYAPTDGQIRLAGEPLSRRKPHGIAK